MYQSERNTKYHSVLGVGSGQMSDSRVIITFSSHVFCKTSPEFLKTKSHFKEIEVLEDTKCQIC